MDLSPLSAMPFLMHDAGPRQPYCTATDIDDDPQTQFSVVSRCFITTTMDVLRDHRCFETPQGWILSLHPGSLRTFLWRPEDGGMVQLPDMERDFPRSCKCLLSGGTAGDDDGRGVVVLNPDDDDYWLCQVRGGKRWGRHGYVITVLNAYGEPRDRNMARLIGVAAVGCRLYYEISGRELGVVELDNRDDDGEPCLTSVDIDTADVDLPDERPLRSRYLVESRGELYLVVVFFVGFDALSVSELAVYKMDFASSPAAWRRVGGIGSDRVFLLGGDMSGWSTFGASCSAGEHRLRGNTIYFVNHVAIEENALHVFDLERGTHMVHRPFHDFPRPFRPPFWMMLTDS
uniref:KIB1-4 beta-propeller domain-containing protein n=1 Tax=Oryza brachyantha TaxID=4533 RepID=J3M0A6_ORYBR